MENGFAVLNGNDPARGKAAAIPGAVDVVDNGFVGIAGAKKVAVERMQYPIGSHGLLGAESACPITCPPKTFL